VSQIINMTKGDSAHDANSQMDLRYAVDAGAYEYVGVRLKVLDIGGSPTGGDVTIAITQAIYNLPGEYGKIADPSGTEELSFRIAHTDQGEILFRTSKHFTRYLAWAVSDWSFTGGTDPDVTFEIDLILK